MGSAEPTFERVANFAALVAAANRAARGHRRSLEVAEFMLNLEPEVFRIERELRAGTYGPRPYRTFAIRDPKPRLISVAAFRDRVVHHSLCAEIGPSLETGALPWSFACRSGKGVSAALLHARKLVRRFPYALKLDVRHFFETLSHGVLEELLRPRIRDPRLAGLTRTFVDAGAPGSAPGCGLPIGNLTSQYFANFYLDPLDRRIVRGLRIAGYCRYMDDVLLFANSKSELWSALNSVERFVHESLALRLKSEVTRLIPAGEGVPFLGFVIYPGTVRFDPARARRWRARMRALSHALDLGSLTEEHAQEIAGSLDGWACHGNTLAFRRAWVARRVGGGLGRGDVEARTG